MVNILLKHYGNKFIQLGPYIVPFKSFNVWFSMKYILPTNLDPIGGMIFFPVGIIHSNSYIKK